MFLSTRSFFLKTPSCKNVLKYKSVETPFTRDPFSKRHLSKWHLSSRKTCFLSSFFGDNTFLKKISFLEDIFFEDVLEQSLLLKVRSFERHLLKLSFKKKKTLFLTRPLVQKHISFKKKVFFKSSWKKKTILFFKNLQNKIPF